MVKISMRLTPVMLLALALLASGCSNVPEKIREAPPSAPTLNQVRQSPDRYTGTQVRWGGSIAHVDNRQNETRIEIVARPLFDDGEPKSVDASEGRFIAIVPGFLDPAIYASDRTITVSGRIGGSIERKLGAMDYRYPIVKVDIHHLWPKKVEYNVPYDPWLYDPWYPWRRYPYY
jgi:outer membrane lipoprotein